MAMTSKIEIELKDGWWLSSDSLNWVFGKKSYNKKYDKEFINGEKFYQDVPYMVETLFERYIKESEAVTMAELLTNFEIPNSRVQQLKFNFIEK